MPQESLPTTRRFPVNDPLDLRTQEAVKELEAPMKRGVKTL
jgi:hypothetical protein